MADEEDTVHYSDPEGGWGSVRGIAEIAWKERPRPPVLETPRYQNKPGGFMCVSCSWAKPAHPHTFEFNTTNRGYSDRLRGTEGTRDVLLMNPEDIAEAGLSVGQVGGLTVTPFLLSRGCLGGYYPELNPLIPLWYHDELSKTPAAKGVPVRIVA